MILLSSFRHQFNTKLVINPMRSGAGYTNKPTVSETVSLFFNISRTFLVTCPSLNDDIVPMDDSYFINVYKNKCDEKIFSNFTGNDVCFNQ